MTTKAAENLVLSALIGFASSILIWLAAALVILAIENTALDINNFFSQLLFWTNTAAITGIVYWLDFIYSRKVKK